VYTLTVSLKHLEQVSSELSSLSGQEFEGPKEQLKSLRSDLKNILIGECGKLSNGTTSGKDEKTPYLIKDAETLEIRGKGKVVNLV